MFSYFNKLFQQYQSVHIPRICPVHFYYSLISVWIGRLYPLLCPSQPTILKALAQILPLPGSLPLLPPPVIVTFFLHSLALQIIPSARHLSYPGMCSYVSFVGMTFALATIL